MLSLLTTPASLDRRLYDELVRLRPHIDAALEYSGEMPTHTFNDIVDGIEAKKFQAWPGMRSILISEILAYPRKKGVHIFLAGGDLDELIDMQEDVATWAKAIGADHLSLCGRRGWKKALTDRGWGHEMMALTRELNDV